VDEILELSHARWPGHDEETRMNRFFLLMLTLVLVVTMLTGCSLLQKRVEKPEWLRQFEDVYGELVPGKIVEVDGSKPIGYADLLDRLGDKRIVYVGEIHNDVDHHDVQLRILEGLYARDPRLVIGMEMFERPYQPVLDAWTDGAVDQKAFIRQSEWFSRWRFDFLLYEKILDFAREKEIKILALNAPRELVSKVGDFGMRALSRGERALIAPIDTSDTLHREYVQKVWEAHRKTPDQTLETFYEAQCVWEDTMAETISSFVKSPEGKGVRIVVLAGAGHVVYKFGIPKRAFGRTGVPYATILPSNLKRLRKEFRRDEKFSSTVLADFFWVTKGSTLKKTRLGVIAEESFAGEDGVVVRRVTGGSSADKAGIEAGDTIVALDGETITDMVDLRVALYGKEPGTVSRLVFVREGEERETAVTFSEIKAH
jgi:uncharacterized iron-regulated protein